MMGRLINEEKKNLALCATKHIYTPVTERNTI